MFLFDIYRSSRQCYSTGNKVSISWKTDLMTCRPYGAESTAVVDKEGNLYFGSHSGNFYSLTRDGHIRWIYSTFSKIYDSPILYNDTVCFVDGWGNIYLLRKDSGKLIWKIDLTKGYKENLFLHIINLPYTFSLPRKINMNTKCWSSPLLLEDKIFITAYGKGAYCIDVKGDIIWSIDLGFPRYQLSGMVSDENSNLYFASRRGYLYSVTINGQINWKIRLGHYNVWGNPSYNEKYKFIIVPLCRSENKGWIVVFDVFGKLKWKIALSSAVRGSAAIDYSRDYIYVGDFAGILFKINVLTGEIVKSIQLCHTERALWTTPTIDSNNDIHIGVKDNLNDGRIIKLDSNLNIIWDFNIGKTLSVPLILPNGDVCAGSWDGHYYCLKTV